MTLRTDILLAISQVHSGNREEGGRIVDTFRTWLAENGLAVVPKSELERVRDQLLGVGTADTRDKADQYAAMADRMIASMLAAAPATGLEGAADTMLQVREQDR
jgi:hypothetical protein